MAEWPCCHDPLRFSPWSPRFRASLSVTNKNPGNPLAPLLLQTTIFYCSGAGNLGFPRRDGNGAEAREKWGFHAAPRRAKFGVSMPRPGARNLGFPAGSQNSGLPLSRLKFGVSGRRLNWGFPCRARNLGFPAGSPKFGASFVAPKIWGFRPATKLGVSMPRPGARNLGFPAGSQNSGLPLSRLKFGVSLPAPKFWGFLCRA